MQIQAVASKPGDRLAVACGDARLEFELTTEATWIKYTFSIPGDGKPVQVSLTTPKGQVAVRVDSYLVGGT